MKKNLIIAAGAVLVAAAVSAFVYVNNEEKGSASLLKANAEALAADEIQRDDLYQRIGEKCEIRADAGVKLNIWGSNIEFKSGGTVSFDGAVRCVWPGSELCEPVNCVDLYEVIF